MAWLNSSWLYRKKITVDADEVDANLTDFPVYVNLANLGSDFFDNVKSDGGDIRITTSDGETEVPVEVVSINKTPVARHLLTSGSGTDTNSYDTASISPGANKLILCAIYNRTSSVAKPIVSGCGLTWVEIDSQVDATNNSRQTLFRAMGTPTPGALTITFEGGQSQLRCGWSISEFDNVDTSGTNGSGAIVQSAKGTVADMSSGLTVTLGAFSNANNATYGTIGHHSNAESGDFTPGSGFTKLGDFEVESVHIQSQWKNSNDTTVEWSTSDTNVNRPACGIAVEIKAGTGIGELHFKAPSLSSSVDTDFYLYYGNSGASLPAANSTYGSQNVWDSNFKAVYHMQSNGNDSTANANNLTNTNSVAFNAGKVGNGADQGSGNTNKYLSIASNLGITGGNITLENWIKRDTSSSNKTVISLEENTNDTKYWINVETNTQLGFGRERINVSFGNYSATVSALGTSFHYTAMTYDGTTLSGYLDGAVVGTPISTSGNGSGTNSDRLSIGLYQPPTNNIADFIHDEVRISNTNRSANWITTTYNNTNSPSTFYSVGEQEIVSTYSRGDEASLPGDDTDLENIYTAQEVEDVSTADDTRVGQSATNEYMIHQFKDDIGAATAVNLTWEGQTTLAPSSSTVYLQIFNRDSEEWETVDSNDSANADTDFTLSGHIADTANYKDEGGVMVCRVYQLAT